MFNTRLKIVLGVFGLVLLVIVVRLIDLQIVRASEFRKQADQALLRPARMLPFVRGRILDRAGTELVADHPCWEIAVDYGVLAMEPSYLRGQARRLRRASADSHWSREQAEVEVRRRIDQMWADLARFSGESVTELHQRADDVCARIARVRAAVTRRRGFQAPVAEERMRHPVVSPLDDQQQVLARQFLGDYPWLEIRDSTSRHYHPSPSLPHILGQQGAVTGAILEDDPERDDPLARYLASESLGISGVERTAEQRLRGRRGLLRENRNHETVENIVAVNGQDTTLTLRLDLQEALYELMGRMLPATPYPTGGAIVVLDVPTREVLALVSYPGYDANTYRNAYPSLALDTRYQPLRFRAVANHYAPGSIIKPLTCIAGLSTGKITLGTVFDCRGCLFPEHPDRWRCWPNRATGGRMNHGPLTVIDAIAHSCNIFMYQTGQRVGVQGLCSFFDMAGLGRLSGIGLAEEVGGINPTPSWIVSRGDVVTPGKARLFAIGQGELSITPVQAANLMAVYASGVYKPVTLIRDEAVSVEWVLPVKPEHWRAIRTGLFRVANQPGATAYKTAHFVRDGYALCGKTGSATVGPWVVAYTVPYTTSDGAKLFAHIPANSKREAIERFESDADYRDMELDRDGIEACEHWPTLGDGRRRPTKADWKEHAWFIAYLQAVDHAGRPMLEVTPRIAFAVLVEFGGSGGRAAGPIAVKVAENILDTLSPNLDPDNGLE